MFFLVKITDDLFSAGFFSCSLAFIYFYQFLTCKSYYFYEGLKNVHYWPDQELKSYRGYSENKIIL